VEKGHAIAMDGLQQQLQNLKKEKEIEDLRKAAAEFDKRHAGFNEVLNHFQDTLLGIITFHTIKFAISAMPYVTRLLSAMQPP
jgi:hypothetical protein